MTRVLPVTAAAIAIAASACAVAPPSNEDPTTSTAAPPAEFSAIAEAARTEHAIPALGAAYLEDGRLVWAGTWGADQDALFNVASLAKPVAAETILRLASDGQLDLDASMAEHYVDPDIADDPRHGALTLRVALSHMTGFPNWRWQTEGTLAFTADPGTRPTYSGEGYEYAGRYAEAVTGRDFRSLIAEEVFEPAGIAADMSTGADDALDARRLAGHDAEGNETGVSISAPWSAADDLWTTPAAYGHFMVSVMLGEGMIDTLTAEREIIGMDQSPFACQDPAFTEFCPNSLGFALGRVVFTYDDDTIIWHGGGDDGEAAVMFYSKTTDRGMVLMANSANGRKAFPALAEAYVDNEDFLSFLRMQAGS